MTPSFSVVTCCYNQGSFLADNIEAVLAQDYPDFEHIVVDDGSTDNTPEVCRRYSHIRYIYQENAGQSAALNRGLQEAKGDVIAWVNSDDYYEPGAFQRVAAELPPPGERVIVAGEANVVNADGAFMWKLKARRVSPLKLLWHPDLYRWEGRACIPCQPSTFFYRSLVEEIGCLKTDLKYGMDYEYWIRAMAQGYRFRCIPQVLSNYRYHADSHTCQGYDTFLPEWHTISRRYIARRSTARRGRPAGGRLRWRRAPRPTATRRCSTLLSGDKASVPGTRRRSAESRPGDGSLLGRSAAAAASAPAASFPPPGRS